MAFIDAHTVKPRNWLKKTGDAMIAGFLTLFQDPTEPLHAVTKQYVDALIGGGSADGFDERHIGLLQQDGRLAAVEALGLNNATNGTASTITDTTGIYVQYQTGTLVGNQGGVTHSGTIDYTMDVLPDIYSVIKTGDRAQDITDCIIWIGLSTNTGLGNPIVGDFVGFRFAPTDLGDVNWIALTANGGTTTTTDSGVAVTVDTRYVFRIKVVSLSSVELYVNGTLVATHTTNLPASLTLLGLNTYIINRTAGSNRRLRFRRWQHHMR